LDRTHALKGQKQPAQGIALGEVGGVIPPCKGKSIAIFMLLPLQGDDDDTRLPRAMPWAMGLSAFQAVCYQSAV